MLGKMPKDKIVKTVNSTPVNGWKSVSDFMGFLLKGAPLEVRKELLSYARMLLSTECNYIKADSSLVSNSGQYRLVTLFRLDGKSLNIIQRRYEMKGWVMAEGKINPGTLLIKSQLIGLNIWTGFFSIKGKNWSNIKMVLSIVN